MSLKPGIDTFHMKNMTTSRLSYKFFIFKLGETHGTTEGTKYIKIIYII
jgi:hypothetical protein